MLMRDLWRSALGLVLALAIVSGYAAFPVADVEVEVPASGSSAGNNLPTVPSLIITSCPTSDGTVLYTDALVLSVSFGGDFRLGGVNGRAVCFTVNGFARKCHSSYPPQWLCPELFTTAAALPADGSEHVRILAEITEGDGTVIATSQCSFFARRWSEKAKEKKASEERRLPIVIDAVMVFDEVDMLELRMRELAPINEEGDILDNPSADLFLIVESEITHSGKRKDMYFADMLYEPNSRFLPWKDRILHIVVRDVDFPRGLRQGEGVYMSQHSREVFQRNQLVRALRRGGIADLVVGKIGLREPGEGLDHGLDIVVFGDADEIPSPVAMEALRSSGGFTSLFGETFLSF